MTRDEFLAQADKVYLRQLLLKSKCMREAAREAGIYRTSLYRLLRKHKLQPPVSTSKHYRDPRTILQIRI